MWVQVGGRSTLIEIMVYWFVQARNKIQEGENVGGTSDTANTLKQRQKTTMSKNKHTLAPQYKDSRGSVRI